MKYQLFALFLISNFCTILAKSDVKVNRPVTPEELQYHKCAVLLSIDMQTKFVDPNSFTPEDQKKYQKITQFLHQQIANNHCLDPLYAELIAHFAKGLALQKQCIALQTELYETIEKLKEVHRYTNTLDKQIVIDIRNELLGTFETQK